MIEAAGDRIRQFRPRSRLVQIAQIELLLHHTQFQTLAAPFLGVFLVLAFAGAGKPAWAWGWVGCLVLAYGARIAATLRLGTGRADKPEARLKIYLIGLAAAGLLWAVAPLAVAVNGSDAQLIVSLFVGIVVLVGIVGNFLYYQSALVYFATWIVPALSAIGFVYVDRFHGFGWTYAGVVLMFLAYAYKCLQVINLPLGETLELNEALVVEKERAVEADSAKSDFLAMMSHELRTPLTAIIGYAEIIRDQMFGPNKDDKYIDSATSIRAAAGMLTDLINDLLDLSALQARGRVLKIENLEIPTLVNSAVELLHDAAAQRQIEIHSLLPSELPVLAVDLRSTVQCLTNILGNAIKYSPDGSDVHIEAEVVPGFVLIRVRDKGVGIPESELSSITEPFRRAENIMTATTQGVGLGLSITENLMKRQRGYLDIASSPDDGTAVTLGFPIAAPPKDASAEENPDNP